jgi:hypothetical protein
MTVQLAEPDAGPDAPPTTPGTAEKEETLEDLITATADLAVQLGATEVGRAVAGVRCHLAETTVRVAVLGGARTGRSTLRAQLADRPDGGYKLVEPPPIDGSLDELAVAVEQTAHSDIVVFTVSAHAALSRTEVEFLAGELGGRRVVLVVTHLDQIDEADEADRVLRAVHRDAAALGPRVVVLPGPGREPDADRLGAVRRAVADVDTATVATERRRLTVLRLGAEIEVLTGLAEAALARQADHAAGQQAVAAQEAVWRGLREALQRRQRRLRERLRGQVDDERDALVVALTRDLAAAPDPVDWWTAELPDRLGRLLLDVGRRLDETVSSRGTDVGHWLELELRSQLGIDDVVVEAGQKCLPVAAVTRPGAPGTPGRAKPDLARDMLRTLRPVLPGLITAVPAFRGKALVAFLAEPVMDIVDQHLSTLAVAERRAELTRQLAALLGRNVDAYQEAVAGGLAAYECAELARFDDRWNDWRAVQTAAVGDGAPDGPAMAERARNLGRQVDLLLATTQPATTQGADR